MHPEAEDFIICNVVGSGIRGEADELSALWLGRGGGRGFRSGLACRLRARVGGLAGQGRAALVAEGDRERDEAVCHVGARERRIEAGVGVAAVGVDAGDGVLAVELKLAAEAGRHPSVEAVVQGLIAIFVRVAEGHAVERAPPLSVEIEGYAALGFLAGIDGVVKRIPDAVRELMGLDEDGLGALGRAVVEYEPAVGQPFALLELRVLRRGGGEAERDAEIAVVIVGDELGLLKVGRAHGLGLAVV